MNMKRIIPFVVAFSFALVMSTGAKAEDFHRKYRNFSWSDMTFKMDDGTKLRSNYGASFTSGRTYFVHSKPIAGLLKIGVDATWVDLNYNNYTGKYLTSEGLSDYNLHRIEYSLQVGPSIAINPVGKLNINAYFRYAPTFSVLLSNPDGVSAMGNYATMFVTGGMVSWGIIGVGAEYRFGDCSYNNFTGALQDFSAKTSGFRAYITLRFK